MNNGIYRSDAIWRFAYKPKYFKPGVFRCCHELETFLARCRYFNFRHLTVLPQTVANSCYGIQVTHATAVQMFGEPLLRLFGFMQRWSGMLGEIIIALLIMFGIGYLICLLLNVRGVNKVFAAPLISIGLVGIIGIIFGAVHIPFNLATFGLTTLTLMALCYFALNYTRLPEKVTAFTKTHVLLPNLLPQEAITSPTPFRRRARRSAQSDWHSFVQFGIPGLLFGALVAILPVMRGIGYPGIPFQGNDVILHYSLARYMVENQVGTPTAIRGLIGTGFYPSLWHTLVALAYQGSIVFATNAVFFVTIGLIWPLGAMAFARFLFRSHPEALLIAPVIAAGFAAFPIRLLGIFPLLLSIAMLPSLVTIFCRILFNSDYRATTLLSAALGTIAVLLAHPQGILLCGIALIYPAIWKLNKLRPWRNNVALVATILLSILSLIALWVLGQGI